MLLFRSEEHVQKWLRDWKRPLGGLLTLEQCWRLAKEWYQADRRDPNWRRRTAAEAEGLFADLGLTSPFWKLSG